MTQTCLRDTHILTSEGGHFEVTRGGRMGNDRDECHRHSPAPAVAPVVPVAVGRRIAACTWQPRENQRDGAAFWPECLVLTVARWSDRGGDAVKGVMAVAEQPPHQGKNKDTDSVSCCLPGPGRCWSSGAGRLQPSLGRSWRGRRSTPSWVAWTMAATQVGKTKSQACKPSPPLPIHRAATCDYHTAGSFWLQESSTREPTGLKSCRLPCLTMEVGPDTEVTG